MVRCREIVSSDGEAVIDLLTQGFNPDRDRDYWNGAFKRLSEHRTPEGFPKYGYMLEHDGKPVGVLLLIYSQMLVNGTPYIRCNISSWYVEPEYRFYATLLSQWASNNKSVTYVNISPAPHTWRMLEDQHFRPFAEGRFLTMPLLASLRLWAATGGIGAYVISPAQALPNGLKADGAKALPQIEMDLLLDHAGYGCLSVVCERQDGWHPFVFALRRKYGVRMATLTYCRDLNVLGQFAAPLGRILARRGYFFLMTDAQQRLPALSGMFRTGVRRYTKGPQPARLGDLAYCEHVMFGF